MKMAANWTHEYPTGTPLMFIRDEILAKWDSADREAACETVDYFAERKPSFNRDAMAAFKSPEQD